LEEVFEKRSLYGFETVIMSLLDDEDPEKKTRQLILGPKTHLVGITVTE